MNRLLLAFLVVISLSGCAGVRTYSVQRVYTFSSEKPKTLTISSSAPAPLK